ncbi:MAG: c-type cytochrome [Oligoflexia bacterium]
MKLTLTQNFGAFAVALLGLVALSGCKHEKPNFIYMPDMYYSPALKAQEEGTMRMPVKGTVPRGFTKYDFAVENNEELGRRLMNPLPRTKSVMLKGQKAYNTYCIVCHGQYGEGDGSIVPKYPRPPSLQSEKITQWPDGRIFHVISSGQNIMPSYSTQLDQEERWAVVHYIRALQRAKNPTNEDLKISESM